MGKKHVVPIQLTVSQFALSIVDTFRVSIYQGFKPAYMSHWDLRRFVKRNPDVNVMVITDIGDLVPVKQWFAELDERLENQSVAMCRKKASKKK